MTKSLCITAYAETLPGVQARGEDHEHKVEIEVTILPADPSVGVMDDDYEATIVAIDDQPFVGHGSQEQDILNTLDGQIETALQDAAEADIGRLEDAHERHREYLREQG